MSEACEVVAYVRSERFVVAAREIRALRPVTTTLAGPILVPVRAAAVTHGRRLPAEHAAALDEARGLAAEARGTVRIVDLGRSNPLARAVLLWWLGTPALPAVVVKGACRWEGIGSGPRTPAPSRV